MESSIHLFQTQWRSDQLLNDWWDRPFCAGRHSIPVLWEGYLFGEHSVFVFIDLFEELGILWTNILVIFFLLLFFLNLLLFSTYFSVFRGAPSVRLFSVEVKIDISFLPVGLIRALVFTKFGERVRTLGIVVFGVSFKLILEVVDFFIFLDKFFVLGIECLVDIVELFFEVIECLAEIVELFFDVFKFWFWGVQL